VPKKICRAAVRKNMKAQIEKQLQEISKLAVKLEVIVEEKLDNEFAGVLQKWADATNYDMLQKENLKRLKVYSRFYSYDSYDGMETVYYLKTCEAKLYYVSQIDYNENNFKYEREVDFKTLQIYDKISIIRSLKDVFEKYIEDLNYYIEKIKKLEE
jgi:hypothetical protein